MEGARQVHRSHAALGETKSTAASVQIVGMPGLAGIPKPILAKPTAMVIEFMAALGREVEPHESAHQILYPTGEGCVGVEDFATLVSGKDASAHHVLAALDRRAIIEDGVAGGDVLLLERHAEIEVEVAVVRGDPRKGPSQNPLDLLDPLDRRARDRGKRQVGVPKVLLRSIDMIGDEGASFAHVIGPRRQHEVLDRELAAALEQICKRAFSFGSFERVGLLDPDPR
jgi:hypothetical protein